MKRSSLYTKSNSENRGPVSKYPDSTKWFLCIPFREKSHLRPRYPGWRFARPWAAKSNPFGVSADRTIGDHRRQAKSCRLLTSRIFTEPAIGVAVRRLETGKNPRAASGYPKTGKKPEGGFRIPRNRKKNRGRFLDTPKGLNVTAQGRAKRHPGLAMLSSGPLTLKGLHNLCARMSVKRGNEADQAEHPGSEASV